MPNTEADRYIHVVAGIIRHPEDLSKIFITRRKKGQHLENLWEFPGGKVEAGESRFHALKRELAEETGIQVNSAIPYQSIYHRYKEKKIFLDVWEVKNYRGQAHGFEGQEACWLSLNEVSEYSFPDADTPVLKALNLPSEILITPDMPEQHEQSFVDQFDRLMQQHCYPLVHFRSHHLDDQTYAGIAKQLNEVCQQQRAELVINRPGLESLQSKLFEFYKRRHLNSHQLQSLQSRPFGEDIIISASCHDRADLKIAERIECNYAVLSMVREASSNPGRQPKGWYKIKQMIKKSSLPVYALGGVRRKDFCISRFQGAIGVAGITDFWAAY